MRRSNDELAALDDIISEAVQRERPTTVRSAFYRVESLGVVPKDETKGYKLVQRRLLSMRRSGRLPWSWITDGTRLRQKPDTYTGIAGAMGRMQEMYRRQIWADAPVYVEVWCEKDAMSGIVYPVTAKWDVPLMVARGDGSETFVYNAAQEINEIGKPTFIYYLGDFDAAGVDIPKVIERKLHGFAPNIEIQVARLAVNPDQIDEYGLPTRPPKPIKNHDAPGRAKHWGDRPCVEVDAFPSRVLRRIVAAAITQHIDQAAYDRLRLVEAAERDTLKNMLEALGQPYDADEYGAYAEFVIADPRNYRLVEATK